MYTKEFIEESVRDAVCRVTGLKNLDKASSLIDKEMGIIPANFLYIFDILETKLKLPVCQIFTDHSYEVMCIENLTDAIYKIQDEKI